MERSTKTTRDPERLRAEKQSLRLEQLLRQTSEQNPFYRRVWAAAGVDLQDVTLTTFSSLPLVTKQNFQDDQRLTPPFGTNLSEPVDHYGYYFQTSGTTGTPVRWLDTEDSWHWRAQCIGHVLLAAGLTRQDRLMLPFSFGPYTAFWGAYRAALEWGMMVVPTGGWTSEQRLKVIEDTQVTVVATTPTYAARLAEVAANLGKSLASSSVTTLILAGEPGAAAAGWNRQMADAWGARVCEFVGSTETGTFAYGCGLAPYWPHIIETEYVVEVINPQTLKPVPDTEVGELVLTALGRSCSPVIRYRTGDLVARTPNVCACGSPFRQFRDGVMGRRDDMLIVRGVNIFPAALTNIVGTVLPVGCPYCVVVDHGENDQDRITVEFEGTTDNPSLATRVQQTFRQAFNLRCEVMVVPPGVLERTDYKSHRVWDKRSLPKRS